MIIKKDKTIKKDLFTEYFQFQSLSAMQKSLSKTQNTQKNKELKKVIISGLLDLDKRIKNMSDDKNKIENPNEIVDAVVAILGFSEQPNTTDMPELENEKFAEQRKK